MGQNQVGLEVRHLLRSGVMSSGPAPNPNIFPSTPIASAQAKASFSRTCQGLNLGQGVALIAGSVLEIDERPVVAGVGHQFGGGRRTERKKTAQHRFALRELFAEEGRRDLGRGCFWEFCHLG